MDNRFRNIALIIGCCFWALSPGFSQEGVFAFLQRPGVDQFAPEAVSGYKYETAKEVFDRLVAAQGDIRMQSPEFVMNNGQQYLAWMDPRLPQIGLEEKAYDLCTAFGADSLNLLAALLAHELVHYYEKHDWNQHFAQHLDQAIEEAGRFQMMESVKLEIESDFLGSLLAFSAGFNAYDRFETFLDKAYTAYGFPPDLDGYPGLQERQLMSRKKAVQLKELSDLFALVNYLVLLGEHDWATDYFHRLLKEYQAYALYNNAAVNAILAALELAPKEQIPFVLPLELDINNRLQELNIRLPEDAEARKQEFLRKAGQYLQNAQQLDPKRPSAWLNQATTAILQEDWLDAEYFAKKALSLAKEGSAEWANGQIALGVMEGLQGDTTLSRLYFEKAVTGNAEVAQKNLQQLQKDPPQVSLRGVNFGKQETIEGVFPGEFLEAPKIDRSTELAPGIYCGYKAMADSDIWLHYAYEGREFLFIQVCRKEYKGKTEKGIGLSADFSTVQEAYGQPARTIHLQGGIRCRVYPVHGLLFFFNTDDQLSKWAVFESSAN